MLIIMDLVGSHWFWISLAVVFLLVEVLSFATSGFLLCFFAGALGTGLFSYLVTTNVTYCLLCFAFITLGSVIAWHYWYKRYSARRKNDDMLNNRTKQLLGYRGILTEPIISGQGRMVVGDTTWAVRSDVDYPVGTAIEVTGAQGIILFVKKV